MNNGGIYLSFPVAAKPSWWLDPQTTLSGIGLIVAVCSALVAWGAYRRSKSASAEAQINAMFREMLAMEFQLYCTSFASTVMVSKALSRFDRYKLWVLEELWIWVDKRDKSLPWFGKKRARAKAANKDWADVISVHIIRCSEETKIRPWGLEAGYHSQFQNYLQNVIGQDVEPPNSKFWTEALTRRIGWQNTIANEDRPLAAARPESGRPVSEELSRLAKLKVAGSLTRAEFILAKKLVLSGETMSPR